MECLLSLHKVLDSFASIERNEKKIKTQDNFNTAPSMLVAFAYAVCGADLSAVVPSGTNVPVLGKSGISFSRWI